MSEHDQIVTLSLASDLVPWRARVLKQFAGNAGVGAFQCEVLQVLFYLVACPGHHAVVPVVLVGTCSQRYGFNRSQARLVNHHQAHQQRVALLGPLDSELYSTSARSRAVQTD